MGRVFVVSGAAILDTSWLLELYKVPGDSNPQRFESVREQAAVAAQGRMHVTVPVLFEVANHIVHVRNGHYRRRLITRFREDVSKSLRDEVPWTVFRALQNDILLRAQDLIKLADRFAEESTTGYSLADISIIDLAQRLQKRQLKVRILAFDKQLEAYASLSVRQRAVQARRGRRHVHYA